MSAPDKKPERARLHSVERREPPPPRAPKNPRGSVHVQLFEDYPLLVSVAAQVGMPKSTLARMILKAALEGHPLDVAEMIAHAKLIEQWEGRSDERRKSRGRRRADR